jgi:cell division protease FtsH
MVVKYGMSDRLGPVSYSSSEEVFLGKDLSTRKNYSEEIAKEIDEEIRVIIENAFSEAERLLTENIDKLHLVAEVLLELETLDGEQFEQLFTGEKTAEELIADTREKERYIEANNAKEAAEHLAELAAEEEDEEDDDDEEDYAYEYEIDDDTDEKDD